MVIPPETEAFVFCDVHDPPETASVNTIAEPTQTIDGPVTAPATGNGLTVTGFREIAVPQPLVTVYFTVSAPGDTP
jgi:hypothetical protein